MACLSRKSNTSKVITVVFTLLLTYGESLISPSNIKVAPVRISTSDVTDLADIRYAEWMRNDPNPPSLEGFRAATAEITAERVNEGSVAFLARLSNGILVGAAELSPIEFRGAVTSKKKNEEGTFLYVTDVVTSRDHRRMGVGGAIMAAIEKHSMNLGVSRLFLHVKEENTAALGFYMRESLGYTIPTAEVLDGINADSLAKNAGAMGQLLLTKTLSKTNKKTSVRGGFGFSSSSHRSKSPKRKKK